MTGILTTATDLLARFDAVVPANGDETLELYKERGWVEAIRHFTDRSLLTPDGVFEAMRILAGTAEWADGLETDINDWPFSLPPAPAVVDRHAVAPGRSNDGRP